MPNYNNKGISCVLSENPHASKNLPGAGNRYERSGGGSRSGWSRRGPAELKESHQVTWSRWWFELFFIFTPKIGEGFQFDEYFSNGLKPPTSDLSGRSGLTRIDIYIYMVPPQKKNLHFLILYRYLQWFLHFWRPFFLGIFLLVLEVVFINVYKHRGCWIQDPRSKILGKTSWIQGLDPRSKILGKTSWIQGLDPRSKIQDSGKNFLDPRSGSKIQDPRF